MEHDVLLGNCDQLTETFPTKCTKNNDTTRFNGNWHVYRWLIDRNLC